MRSIKMCKSLALAACCGMAALPLCADTIGWWRFSQGDGATITNAADAATFTGTLKSITTAGASPTYGDDSSQFPTWNAGFSDKADILDPVTKTVRPATGALRWNMGATKSGLVIPTTSGDALHGNTFTTPSTATPSRWRRSTACRRAVRIQELVLTDSTSSAGKTSTAAGSDGTRTIVSMLVSYKQATEVCQRQRTSCATDAGIISRWSAITGR